MEEPLTNDDLQEHLDGLPELDELIDAAMKDMPENGQIALDQGVAYVRDIASKMSKEAAYGSQTWNEIWSAATIVMFNVLSAMIPAVEGLNEKMLDALALQFFLLGTQGTAVDLESMAP